VFSSVIVSLPLVHLYVDVIPPLSLTAQGRVSFLSSRMAVVFCLL
jgi:hypothetical protein